MKYQFSYRYRSLVGVEGTLDTEALTLTVRVIFLGATLVVFSGGLTLGTANALRGVLAKIAE